MENKSILKSKTAWGAGVAIAATIIGYVFKIDITEENQKQIVDLIESGAVLFGGILAIYGRIKANTKIGK